MHVPHLCSLGHRFSQPWTIFYLGRLRTCCMYLMLRSPKAPMDSTLTRWSCGLGAFISLWAFLAACVDLFLMPVYGARLWTCCPYSFWPFQAHPLTQPCSFVYVGRLRPWCLHPILRFPEALQARVWLGFFPPSEMGLLLHSPSWYHLNCGWPAWSLT